MRHPPPFDAEATPLEVTAQSPTSNNLTTANANDLLVTGITHDGATTTFTVPSGWTAGPKVESATNEDYGSAYNIVSATQNATYQWTTGASRNCSVVVASYKAGAAAAFVAPPPRIFSQAVNRAASY